MPFSKKADFCNGVEEEHAEPLGFTRRFIVCRERTRNMTSPNGSLPICSLFQSNCASDCGKGSYPKAFWHFAGSSTTGRMEFRLTTTWPSWTVWNFGLVEYSEGPPEISASS